MQPKRPNRLIGIGLTAVLVFFVTGCDPEGKKKCQWTLEPEPNLKGSTTVAGMIPVCARNRTTNKEDCRFQADMEYAKSAWMKKFRYVDIESDNSQLPRIIKNIKFCSDK